MPHNSPQQEVSLNPQTIRTLLHELHEFKKTTLYAFYTDHYDEIYDVTVDQVLNEPLKGPETLYAREGMIGEARAAKFSRDWFTEKTLELQDQLKKLDDNA